MLIKKTFNLFTCLGASETIYSRSFYYTLDVRTIIIKTPTVAWNLLGVHLKKKVLEAAFIGGALALRLWREVATQFKTRSSKGNKSRLYTQPSSEVNIHRRRTRRKIILKNGLRGTCSCSYAAIGLIYLIFFYGPLCNFATIAGWY